MYCRNLISNFLINGFVNPLGAGLVLRGITDPNTRSVTSPLSPNLASTAEALASGLLNLTAGDEGGGSVQSLLHRAAEPAHRPRDPAPADSAGHGVDSVALDLFPAHFAGRLVRDGFRV